MLKLPLLVYENSKAKVQSMNTHLPVSLVAFNVKIFLLFPIFNLSSTAFSFIILEILYAKTKKKKNISYVSRYLKKTLLLCRTFKIAKLPFQKQFQKTREVQFCTSKVPTWYRNLILSYIKYYTL
jgi:hypothetical protein